MQDGPKDAKTSGADSGPFPVQSSVLDEEALLSRVVVDYAIPAPESCRFLTRGNADIYRVKTSSSDFYLKVYRPPQSLERTETEARFVAALSSLGIPVVKPVRRLRGRYAFQVSAPEGTRPLLLFEEAPPPLPSQLDEALCSRMGQQVALLHAAADELAPGLGIAEIQSDSFLRERVSYTGQFLSKQDRAYLSEVSTSLRQVLRQLPRSRPSFGLCHGDLVMSNLRLSVEGTITLFDFGSALKTWRTFELAVVYWSLGHRHRDQRRLLWQAFLQGYEAIRPLPEALPEQLSVMLVLRQIGFLGGNCATLPLRLGTEPFESGFIEKGMERLRRLVEGSGILG